MSHGFFTNRWKAWQSVGNGRLVNQSPKICIIANHQKAIHVDHHYQKFRHLAQVYDPNDVANGWVQLTMKTRPTQLAEEHVVKLQGNQGNNGDNQKTKRKHFKALQPSHWIQANCHDSQITRLELESRFEVWRTAGGMQATLTSHRCSGNEGGNMW